MRGNAGDVDNAALFPREHARPKLLAWQQRPANQVQIRVGLPIRQCNLFERSLSANRYLWFSPTGSVDKYGWSAESAENRLMGCAQAILANRIGFEESSLGP